MTHRHAFRRHVTPRPSERDLRTWRRLLTRAAKVTRTPCADPMPFVRAAERAAKAIMPPGHQGERSVFVALVRLARESWLKLDAEGRKTHAEEVGRLAGLCQIALDAYEDQPKRSRADLDA